MPIKIQQKLHASKTRSEQFRPLPSSIELATGQSSDRTGEQPFTADRVSKETSIDKKPKARMRILLPPPGVNKIPQT